MRVPLEWLKEFVEVNVSPEDLAEKLTMHGVEVVALEFHGKGLDKVVVGKIKAREPHPQTPGVYVCSIDIGTSLLQVLTDVAGINVGDKVPVALEGGVIARDVTIKKMELHGIESFGMLCKPQHLGLPEADTIMKMPLDATIGKEVKKVIGLGGYVVDIDVLPNRGDCLSIQGVAREVAAVLGKKVKKREKRLLKAAREKSANVKISVLEKKACPRYTARLIRNVKIGPSPEWLRNRLLLCGVRPVNNVVDVTNYILLEMGQPLHAFDLDLLGGKKIVVRYAKPGEKIKTIDGHELLLSASNLVIADEFCPVALAGIMGGQNTEVSAGTQNILLESAFFEPLGIYRSSRQHKIRTESSLRFEKKVDVEVVEEALEAAAALITEVAGGIVDGYKADILSTTLVAPKISLSLEKVKRLLGVEIRTRDIKKTLTLLGFKFAGGSEKSGKLKFLVPWARARDVEREIDLIEELIRIYGYERVPLTLPKVAYAHKQPNAFEVFIERLRGELTAMGAFEIKTFSMISPKDFDRLGLRLDDPSRNVPALANPLDEDAAVMRPTLLAGVLKTMALNQNWQVAEVAFFELEKTFKAGGPNDLKEDFSLCVGLTAVPRQAGWKKTDKEEPDFFIIKGWVEKIMRAARVETFEIAALPCKFLQPGNAATLMVNQQRLGYLGKLHPGLQASYDLKREIYVLEINLSLLFKYVNAAKKCRPLPKYPAVTRDIAMIVSAATTYQSIKTVILAEGADLVEEIELFDFYTGRPVPDGHYSLALRITYRDKNKTCLDAEINQRHARVLEKLKTALNVEIRM